MTWDMPYQMVGPNQPAHWFLGSKGLGIQQGTSAWIGSPKSCRIKCWVPKEFQRSKSLGHTRKARTQSIPCQLNSKSRKRDRNVILHEWIMIRYVGRRLFNVWGSKILHYELETRVTIWEDLDDFAIGVRIRLPYIYPTCIVFFKWLTVTTRCLVSCVGSLSKFCDMKTCLTTL